MKNTDLAWYYNQLKDHFLEPVTAGEEITAFYLRKKLDSRLMSTLLIFSPEGIVITGDLRPAARGVIALGYGLGWFSGPLEPRYLAEKFLQIKWVPERFAAGVRGYLNDQFQARVLSIKRHPWRIGCHVEDSCTEGRALLYLISHPELIETPHVTFDHFPAFRREGFGWYSPFNSDFLSPGYDYDPAELGWLAAIQRRFSELIWERGPGLR